MSNIDKISKDALREVAEDAQKAHKWEGLENGLKADGYVSTTVRFIQRASPQTVLALLDELEAMHKYAKDRDAENEGLMLTVGRLRAEKEAAEKRIAELEASHGNLREAMAGIHNTITGGGAHTPLAAILNASKRAYEESAAAAGKGDAS
ncbi:TPA: ead/Ea22-like family protein [Enterobacter hormaechei subsp. xiangfangensis]|nr:ead/Ea22-like family protein [Enterobacter hormaechei subsp. xiangfangensis]